MPANDFAAQNGTEKLATNALTTVNGTNVAADLIECPRVKVGHGSDGVFRDVDAANGLPIVTYNNSLVSTLNSSAVNLALNTIFTGLGEDASEHSTAMITIFADQESAVDGLRIEQSSTGAAGQWDFVDAFTIPASTGKVFSVGIVARFFRVVYTNGGVATTALRLQVLFSKQAKKNSSVRPQDGRTNDNDFEEVLAYPMVYIAATNTWERARGTQANGSAVDVTRSALPTGAATETSLAGVRTDLGTDGTTPPAILGGGTGVRGWLRSIYEKLTGTLAVTGTFFQASQPVSLAINTPDVTDRAARALGTIANTAFSANAGTNLNTSLLSLDSTLTNHTQRFQAATSLTTLSAANAAVTLTLPAVVGQFHYITRIRITMHNVTATAVGAAVSTLAFTSTNIPTALAWTEGNALAAGTSKTVVDEVLENPIKSTTVNTNTTIVAPAGGVGVLVRITAYYYTAA